MHIAAKTVGFFFAISAVSLPPSFSLLLSNLTLSLRPSHAPLLPPSSSPPSPFSPGFDVSGLIVLREEWKRWQMCGRHWIAETTEAPFFLFARYFSFSSPLIVFIILNIIILWKNRKEETHEVAMLCGRDLEVRGWGVQRIGKSRWNDSEEERKKRQEPRQRVAELSWSYETIQLSHSVWVSRP